ncbi:MAG: dTMP kinase [Treponema sp.]|nr:dTMP kinase [Treponema sp.]
MFTDILDNFVVFEGGDGSGTSTQMGLLGGRLAGGNPVFFPTAEPTDGAVGRLIRLALKGSPALEPGTLARLFAADRNEHLYAPGGVRDRCLRGELVVCDRYVLSSLAYQGIECGEDLPRALNSGFPAPGLLLFFDLDPLDARERMRSRESLDIFENLEFQRKVRDRYLSLLDEYRNAGGVLETIDASRDPEKVALDVWRAISQMPIMKRGAQVDA